MARGAVSEQCHRMSNDDEVLELGAALTAAFEVRDLWVAPVEGGYLQQHIFRDMGRGAGEVPEPSVTLRVHVCDGRVARIEEHNDPAGRQRP